MANVNRFLHADPKRAGAYPVDTGTVIEVGDLVYLDTNDIKPASSLTYITAPASAALDLAATQAQFAAMARGVALDASASGDTSEIAVASEGIYSYPCASSTWEIGDLVGPDDDATPLLTDQQVINVTQTAGTLSTTAGAIGRCVKREASATTTVHFELMLPYQRIITPQLWSFGNWIIDTVGEELVTDWPVPIPFAALELRSNVTVLTASAAAIAVHNGATALDDVLVIADASAVGTFDSVSLVDATGDHIFSMGDTLSILSDGTPTAGEANIQLLVQPYAINPL